PRLPTSTLFPYTTLFRSRGGQGVDVGILEHVLRVPARRYLDHGPTNVFRRRQVSRQHPFPQRADTPRQKKQASRPFRSDLAPLRSEEHTSELQSLRHLVC